MPAAWSSLAAPLRSGKGRFGALQPVADDAAYERRCPLSRHFRDFGLPAVTSDCIARASYFEHPNALAIAGLRKRGGARRQRDHRWRSKGAGRESNAPGVNA